MTSRLSKARGLLAANGWQSRCLPFDDAHRQYGPTLLPKVTAAGRQSVLDRLCVTVEAWAADGITILFATCEADTLVDTVVWQDGQPAVVTPSLHQVMHIAATRALIVDDRAASGRPHHQALRVA